MTLESLISTYGYAAVAVGTFLEGETILVLAGFAAHQGCLHLPWVYFWAFFGTLCGDQLYFHIGRRRGIAFLEKHPFLKARSPGVFEILNRRPLLLALGFRFLYGMRTITPFLLGAGGFRPAKFLFLNVVGGLIWTLVIGGAGFLFGRAAELVLGKIKRYELFFFAALALCGIAIWIIAWLRRRKAAGGKPTKDEIP
jgi:membrane protein DedA with SNARE-associated domain